MCVMTTIILQLLRVNNSDYRKQSILIICNLVRCSGRCVIHATPRVQQTYNYCSVQCCCIDRVTCSNRTQLDLAEQLQQYSISLLQIRQTEQTLPRALTHTHTRTRTTTVYNNGYYLVLIDFNLIGCVVGCSLVASLSNLYQRCLFIRTTFLTRFICL